MRSTYSNDGVADTGADDTLEQSKLGHRLFWIVWCALIFGVGGWIYVDSVQRFERGECVWATWEGPLDGGGRHSRHRIVRHKVCLDLDDPRLQDPEFRAKAKFRGELPPLNTTQW